jgi:hypothetical protein
MAKNNVRQMTVVQCGHSTVDAVAENFLTIWDGRHAKHHNGCVVFYATWGVFILYNAKNQF